MLFSPLDSSQVYHSTQTWHWSFHLTLTKSDWVNLLRCVSLKLTFKHEVWLERKGGWNGADVAHPMLNQLQYLFEALISRRLVLIVGLHVACCDIVHHLQHQNERSTLKSDTASFCPLYLYQHFILFFVFFVISSLCGIYWFFFHSYFSPPAAFSSSFVSFEACNMFVSTSLNMCVTLLWLENPQIPAATSMANMISRKKKNCTVDKTKWHSADGVDAWLHAAACTCPTLAHVSVWACKVSVALFSLIYIDSSSWEI